MLDTILLKFIRKSFDFCGMRCISMTAWIQLELFHDEGPYHIETYANQWTGFYMIGATVMKELSKTGCNYFPQYHALVSFCFDLMMGTTTCTLNPSSKWGWISVLQNNSFVDVFRYLLLFFLKNYNPFMQNVEKWLNIHEKPLGDVLVIFKILKLC